MKHWNWDNLRFLIALAEHSTLSKASEHLGVSHTTVQRGIHVFEEELQAQLFLKTPDGYQLTDAGQLLYEQAHSLRDTIYAVSRQVAASEKELAGAVTVATTDTIGYLLMPDILRKIADKHPRLIINLIVDNKLSDLARLEADIAVRAGSQPTETLIGKPLGHLTFSLCASKRYLAEHPFKATREAEPQHRYITFNDSYKGVPFYEWLRQNTPANAIKIRADGLMNACQLCRAGLGVTLLPSFIPKQDRQLVELDVRAQSHLLKNELWLLSHAELRDNLRIKTVKTLLSELLGPVFETQSIS